MTWRISARAEILARLLKQILVKSNVRLHGEGFSPIQPNINSKTNDNPVCHIFWFNSLKGNTKAPLWSFWG